MNTFFPSWLGKASLMLAAALLSMSVTAQELRVGLVNLDRILRESNIAKAAQTKLEQEFSRRERELQSMAQQLKAASDKFEREAPTLAESQRVVRQRQLVNQDQEFQRKQRELQEDMNLRRNEELQAVVERANRVIKQVAEAEKFDLVLQEAVYIHPRLDITDKVLAGMNAAR